MSSNNNNNDDNGEIDNGIGRAYSIHEEYSQRLSRNNANPVEYLEFLAAQEQYAPKNLSLQSLQQDSLPSSSQLQPINEQFIQIKQAPSVNVHYTISPDDNPQQNLTNTLLSNNTISNNNINNYNPYFPPTEQQIQQFYHNKHTSNPLPLPPLDEVGHNPIQYQIDDTNANQQIYQQSSQYQQNQQQLQQLQQPQQSQQQFQQPQQMQQFQRHYNNNIDDDDDDDDQSSIDHSAVTPSPLSLPGLFLSRNRSRISTPKIESMPRIPNAYTAQVQQSDSPLRMSELDSDSDPSKRNSIKNMLGEILNRDRLSNFKERTVIKDSNESLVKFDFRNANGDPDDPLLNKNIQPREDKEEERPLPTGLLTGNINNSNHNIDSTINTIPHQQSSIVSPVSTTSITPIIQKPNENEDKNHDVIKIGPDMEIKIHKPKQGTILMLLAVFILAAIIFISWKLGDWGVGDAQAIYNVSTNNGFLTIYPSST